MTSEQHQYYLTQQQAARRAYIYIYILYVLVKHTTITLTHHPACYPP